MDIRVGDIVDFPEHEKSIVTRDGYGGFFHSQGLPGRFKVKSIVTSPDGCMTLDLEKLPDVTTEQHL